MAGTDQLLAAGVPVDGAGEMGALAAVGDEPLVGEAQQDGVVVLAGVVEVVDAAGRDVLGADDLLL